MSQTSDPTGAYYRYAFSYGTNFPDYPKMGVWSDGYYFTFDMFNSAGTSYLGAKACAYDKARMLAGLSATQQCFDTSSSYGSLLASSIDGSTAPPIGEYWTCKKCSQRFDTFQTAATCPSCGTQYAMTGCLDCRQQHPMNEWISNSIASRAVANGTTAAN